MKRHQLVAAIHQKSSCLCVGLDPDPDRMPRHIPRDEDGLVHFAAAIINATRPYCVAYKPNLAFYEAFGLAGWKALHRTIAYIGDEHLVIADAKRGDIGNTAAKYAEAIFDQLGADAVTLAPYMGRDAIQPFLDHTNKWSILLALTSNPSSQDFQRITDTRGKAVYEHVLHTAAQWGSPEQLMFVVGATHPDDFQHIRRIVPDHFLLVPGVGAQGGSLEAVMDHGQNADVGLLINSSRGILYAGDGEDFAHAAGEAAAGLQVEMSRHLS